MTAIAQLEENRTVEGVYAVARKERLRTKGGAPYLALELVDSSGRILVADINNDALRGLVTRALQSAPLRSYPATPDGHHSYAGGLLEHTVGVATLCRETAQLHPRLRPDLLIAAALVHDIGRTQELGPPPLFAPTEDGKLLGHVHLALRTLEGLGAPAELLHAVACHHDVRAARTAEAAVLYHANQLDAVAATRPVPA
jgi:3'-5' exoribonuclease